MAGVAGRAPDAPESLMTSAETRLRPALRGNVGTPPMTRAPYQDLQERAPTGTGSANASERVL